MKPLVGIVAQMLRVALVAVLGTLTEGCTFPSYMTKVRLWDTFIRNEGLAVGALFMFEQSYINIRAYAGNYTGSDKKYCARSLGNDKYIISENVNDQTIYTCWHFHKRSPYVVQYKFSDNYAYDDDSLCNDDLLVWCKSPLVFTGVIQEYIPCALQGGYNIREVYDSQGEAATCVDSPLTPRVESECVAGEGVVFRLQHPDCTGSLHMGLSQETVCLASWHQMGFQFLIISETNTGFWSRKMWMIRVPSSHATDFHMHIFKDLVIDAREDVQLTHYVRFNVTKNTFSTLCEDESSLCGTERMDCEGQMNQGLCQATCGVCNYLIPPPDCEFSMRMRGEWLESSVSYSRRMVRVTTSMLYADDLPAFTCFNPSQRNLSAATRRPLYAVFSNGCKPRYSCIEFSHLSDTILQYRMSQSVTWPHTDDISNDDICRESLFVDDSPPLDYRYRSERMKNIVLQRPIDLTTRNDTTCGWPMPMNFTVQYTGANQNCDGILVACNITGRLVMVFNESCGSRPRVEIFTCLGSYQDDTWRYILTAREIDSLDMQCWIVRQAVSEEDYSQLYLLRPAECNRDTINDVEYHSRPETIANFLFQPTDAYEFCDLDYDDLHFTTPSMPTSTYEAGAEIHIPNIDDDILEENYPLDPSGAGSETVSSNSTDDENLVGAVPTSSLPHTNLTTWPTSMTPAFSGNVTLVPTSPSPEAAENASTTSLTAVPSGRSTTPATAPPYNEDGDDDDVPEPQPATSPKFFTLKPTSSPDEAGNDTGQSTVRNTGYSSTSTPSVGSDSSSWNTANLATSAVIPTDNMSDNSEHKSTSVTTPTTTTSSPTRRAGNVSSAGIKIALHWPVIPAMLMLKYWL